MKKKLICDIDSTINNHWIRIQKWTLNNKDKEISWKAFTENEIMLDKPLPNSIIAIQKLSKNYSIHFLSARGFNGYSKWRIIPEKFYEQKFGYYFLKLNNLLSKIWSKIFSKKGDSNYRYAYPITKKWLDKNGFYYNKITIVNHIEDKINIIKRDGCDLLIDDMSWGQNKDGPYINLYDNFISELNDLKINYEIFSEHNNWLKILNKYS